MSDYQIILVGNAMLSKVYKIQCSSCPHSRIAFLCEECFLACILYQISHGSESQPRQLLCASVSTVVPDLTVPKKCQSRPHAKMVLLEVCPILQRVSSSICTVCTGAGKLTKSALAIERRERETKLYFLVFIARVRSHGGGREGGKKGVELK